MRRRTLLAAAAAFPLAARAEDDALRAAIADPRRSPKFVARDAARHPYEELTFFGLRPDATVVEIWPDGGYWTEILAPYLRDHGHYVAAVPTADATPFGQKLAADKARYDRVVVTTLDKGTEILVPDRTADAVYTFRNVHNWMKAGTAERMFADFALALKPGCTLGMEEHRGRADQPQDPRAASGYVRQDYATGLATAAGFRLAGSSEIDANPRDTADWPGGVWSLPPTYAHGDLDRAKYAAVGEADNFVLRFTRAG